MKKIKIEHLPIAVYFTTSRNEYSKKLDIDTDNFNGLCYSNKKNGTIWVGVFVDDISVLVHELFHAIQFINDIILSDINDDTQEHNAYLIQYLTQKCLPLMKFKNEEDIKIELV